MAARRGVKWRSRWPACGDLVPYSIPRGLRRAGLTGDGGMVLAGRGSRVRLRGILPRARRLAWPLRTPALKGWVRWSARVLRLAPRPAPAAADPCGTRVNRAAHSQPGGQGGRTHRGHAPTWPVGPVADADACGGGLLVTRPLAAVARLPGRLARCAAPDAQSADGPRVELDRGAPLGCRTAELTRALPVVVGLEDTGSAHGQGCLAGTSLRQGAPDLPSRQYASQRAGHELSHARGDAGHAEVLRRKLQDSSRRCMGR